MSVAIIVDTIPRWSERFIARELNELLRRGIDFKIYCLRAGDSDCERDPEFVNLIPLRIVLPSCILPSFARNIGAETAAKERMKLVENELGVTAFRQIGCADSLTKIIREHGHKIVYAHFASLPSTLGWLAATALNLPFVMSCHARDVFVEGQLLKEKIEYARRVFTCNSRAFDVLSAIETDNGIDGKAVLMRHGLPLDMYPFTVRCVRNEGYASLRLLASGRLVPKKGFDILIDALTVYPLKSEGAHVELIILGDGPERKRLMKQTLLRLLKMVSFHEHVLGEELKRHYDWADALVVPSIEKDGDSDGVPNVVLEAFAYGLPVIGSQAGSLKDVLTLKTGFIANIEGQPITSDSLAHAIHDVFVQPNSAKQRAESARRIVDEHYDIRKNIEPLITELTRF